MSKIHRDDKRIRKLLNLLDRSNMDILVGLDSTTIRYLLGNLVDYSIAYITRDGITGVITHVMEYERAKDVTWANEVLCYSHRETGDEYVIKAIDPIEAFMKKFNDGKLKIGIPYSRIAYSQFLKFTKKYESILNADDILEEARMIKTDYELELIKKACEIVDYGIKVSMEIVKDGIREDEVALEAMYAMRKYGADRVYDFLIVASGYRSAYPHGRASNKVIRAGEAVTLDYVASYNGYYADETRTIFLGKIPPELKKVYEVVLEAQNEAINHIRDGVKACDIDAVARSIISKYGYEKYFIHSTGHGLGLDVHERPRLSSTDETILRENMVVTVEPGIYIPKIGGVRIEDDVLVKSDGAEILTKNSKILEEMIV